MSEIGRIDARDRVISYARVTKPKDWNYIPVQFGMLRENAQRLNQRVVGEFHDTGSKGFGKIPVGMHEVLHRVRAKECDIVQACDLSRFGGDDNVLRLFEFCQRNHVVVQVLGVGVISDFHATVITVSHELRQPTPLRPPVVRRYRPRRNDWDRFY
jgi:hypothetical protein